MFLTRSFDVLHLLLDILRCEPCNTDMNSSVMMTIILFFCLTTCQVVSFPCRRWGSVRNQSPSEVDQLREFNKRNQLQRYWKGRKAKLGTEGHPREQQQQEASTLHPKVGETNRGTELSEPWSHCPRMDLEWEQQRSSHCGRSSLNQIGGERPWLLFFCQYSYFTFLSFTVLIPLGPGQVTPANGVGRNQLPSIQSKRKNEWIRE